MSRDEAIRQLRREAMIAKQILEGSRDALEDDGWNIVEETIEGLQTALDALPTEEPSRRAA